MRDPDRIDRIIERLKVLWKRNPDWRFCQLYVNLFGPGDNFYAEDDNIEEILKKELGY